jgi:hypothetical protein
MSEMFTNCPICGERCGLAVTLGEGRITKIGPDKDNPLSWRDFCVRGACHPRDTASPGCAAAMAAISVAETRVAYICASMTGIASSGTRLRPRANAVRAGVVAPTPATRHVSPSATVHK